VGIHLERQGYTVAIASSAVEGEKRVAQDKYHLVVSDIEMPDIDGIEFLKRIREQQPGVGVIIMTAYPENHPRTMALRAGADGYIRKPFNLNQFSKMLERSYWNALTRADALDVEQTL
jgi:DNA-binding response OmpR family regulator